ncbi:MAG: CRISPR-associated endonuclease Cas1 [Candidatus Auribacterota bacterium]
MKHLCIVEHGTFLGLDKQRIVVQSQNKPVSEYPLNRIKTITIAKKGISFSSDVITACAQRGIKLFFLDYRGQPCACLAGFHFHAVTAIRKQQFIYIDSIKSAFLARDFVYGKIRNQRATLKYFSKYYHKLSDDSLYQLFTSTADKLQLFCDELSSFQATILNWRSYLMGIEGKTAHLYWQCYKDSKLLPESFSSRSGRNAPDITNAALNYGYAILTSYIWNAVINAGLEAYAGVLHTDRPGKPSLVLDIMEVYRPWTVDRVIMKNRSTLNKELSLTPKLKKAIIEGIQKTFSKNYSYKNKQLSLESIVQRQIYRLSGTFMGQRKYKPYIFRW